MNDEKAYVRIIILALAATLPWHTALAQGFKQPIAHEKEAAQNGTGQENIPVGMNEQQWTWLKEAVTRPLTFESESYQKELYESSKYFTRKGWKQFTEVLHRSRLLESSITESFSVNTVLEYPPKLIKSGKLNGRQGWIFRVTQLITHHLGTETRIVRHQASITVVRDDYKPFELAIAAWISEPPNHE